VKHGYVVSSMTFPTSADDARSLGRDLTGDGKPDNQLGVVLGTLAGQGFDFNALAAETLTSGKLVLLHSLRTTSLANARGATLRLLRGKAKLNPDLDGGGLFRVDDTAPSVKLPTSIKHYRVKAGPGAIPLTLPALYAGGTPTTLTLKKGRVYATCKRAGCIDGRINGAIPMKQINGRLVPALAKLFQSMVDRDCPTKDTCEPNSAGATVLNLFDANDDGQIPASELRESPFIQGLLAPDVDLVAGGPKDAMSFAVGFASVRARIRGD